MANKQTKAEKQADLVKPATTNEPSTTQAVKPEPTSEKLEELKKAKSAAMASAASAQIAGDEKAAEDKFLEVYKISEDIKRELAAIKQHQAELLKKEKEAAIIKLFDAAIEANDANKAAIGDKSLSIEEKNELNNAYQAAREVIVNRLLGSRPVSEKTVVTKGTKGANTNDISAAMDAGKTYDEMIAEGFKDGTIRSTAWKLQYAKNSDGTYTKK